MRKKKHLVLRLTGAVLCLTILAAGLTANRLPAGEISVSAKTLAELQEERKANDAKIAEKQKELDALQSDIQENEAYQETLREKITLQQKNLDIVSEELTRINDSIEQTVELIADTEDEITVMEADIAIGLEEFKLRLRAMYVQGNDSLASALVGATDFYDLLSKYELMSRIANHDNDLVNDLKDKLEKCNAKKAELESEKESLEKQQTEQQEKKDEFTAALLDLQDTYAETEEAQETMEREKEKLNVDVDTLEANNKALDDEEAKIRAEIQAAAERKQREEKERKRAEAAAAKKAQQQQQSSNNSSNNTASGESSSDNSSSGSSDSSGNTDTSYDTSTPSYSGGSFTWPCPGYYAISSGYGSRWGTTHGAIDIAGGNAGASVVASRSGTVVRVSSGCSHNYPKSSSCGCGGGYGNYVIIQHDGRYSTLYGHMASVAVSAGQSVSAGQTIGYVGSTGFSTGFHLHFEVRVNGAKVDPMQYLS